MKTSKILRTVIAVSGIALLVTGCSSFETNRQSEKLEIKMPLEVIPNVEAGSAKVEGSAKVNSLFGIFTWGVEKQAVGVIYGIPSEEVSFFRFFVGANDVARNGAAYDACTKANADILLTPQYDISVKDYFVFKTVECQVRGFPGTIKGVTIKK